MCEREERCVDKYEPIFNGWRVGEYIGEGNFSKVYRIFRENAENEIIAGKPSVVKHVPVRNGENGEIRLAKYLNEIKILNKLQRVPHIVLIEDHRLVDSLDGNAKEIFIRMEMLTPLLAPQGTDHATSRGSRQLSVDEALNVGIDMCEVLRVLRSIDIVHLDIKPENIFLSERGFDGYKLADFGISWDMRQRRFNENALSLGTGAYMAPEVLRGNENIIDGRADIYSLGMTLYTLLNGNNPPFPFGRRDQELPRLQGNVPAPVSNIIMRACALNVRERYQRPEDMLNDLRDFQRERERIAALRSPDYEGLHIMTIASGDRTFNEERLQDIRILEDKEFFLAPPSDLLEDLKRMLPSSIFREKDSINVFPTIPGSNINEETMAVYLEEAKREVAENFLGRNDGNFFNGQRFGVYRAHGGNRTPDVEEPVLTIELFPTDYYTFKVLEKIIIDKVRLGATTLTASDLNRYPYNLFRASFGISVIVVSTKSNAIIMSRRGQGAAYAGSRNIYVSVTEAISLMDTEREFDDNMLQSWIYRGLKEELGIEKDCVEKIDILDLFFEQEHYQDNLAVIVYLKEEISFEDVVALYREARDGHFETIGLFGVDNDMNSINDFLQTHEDEIKPQANYTLRRYLLKCFD